MCSREFIHLELIFVHTLTVGLFLQGKRRMMDTPPLITILIPTYNRAHYLRQAIQSALAQTYAPLEILVLDNASTDDTPSIAAEFTQEPRVRYLRSEVNGGITGNWRRGIEATRGEFFCLLHDDDTLEPEFIARLALPLQADGGLVVSFCDHWLMDAQGARQGERTQAISARFHRDKLTGGRLADFARAALVNGSLCAGAALFRRSQATPELIQDEARGAIDFWLFYQCVKTGSGAYYVADRLMNYRAHAGGMSASAPAYMAEGHLFRLRHILADRQLSAIHADTRRLLAATLTDYGIHLLAAADLKAARIALREGLRLRMSRRGAGAYMLACGGAGGVKAANALRRKAPSPA